MDLWQLVLADHANILELCREVLRATGGGPNGRAGLFAELDVELERHLRAKERVLYPALDRDDRTRNYLTELGQERQEIRRRMDELASMSNVNSRDWAQDFKQLTGTISHYFTLEEGGVLTLARTIIEPHELDTMRRAYEREKIASIEARRWHMPQAMMPSRYGASTGMVFGVLASVAAIGAATFLWNSSRKQAGGANRPLRPVQRRPEPPFPLRSGVVDTSLGRGGRFGRGGMAGSGMAGSASDRQDLGAGIDSDLESGLGAGLDSDVISGSEAGQSRASGMNPAKNPAQSSGMDDPAKDTSWFSSANPPRAPSGLATGLQPGGLSPGGGPAASTGSIGTGGAQTGNQDTGSLKRDGR